MQLKINLRNTGLIWTFMVYITHATPDSTHILRNFFHLIHTQRSNFQPCNIFTSQGSKLRRDNVWKRRNVNWWKTSERKIFVSPCTKCGVAQYVTSSSSSSFHLGLQRVKKSLILRQICQLQNGILNYSSVNNNPELDGVWLKVMCHRIRNYDLFECIIYL
jgi:hypothetical protein